MVKLIKKIGETPLECLERYRLDRPELKDVPMTYAGRLDPMAEGILIILIGDECKEKEKYLNLDKEYEIEILFGIKTDSSDVLGIISEVYTDVIDLNKINLDKYVTKFIQDYPSYSSKTVDGVQLHTLARSGNLPDIMPQKEVEIYSINRLNDHVLSGNEIAEYSISNILKVNGDFRQNEIVEKWNWFKDKYSKHSFPVLKIKVSCSSGTYMRSLAEKIASDIGTVGMALSIKRIKVGGYF